MKQEPKIIDFPIIKFSMDVHRSVTYSWPEGKDGKGDKLFETDTCFRTFDFLEDIDLIDVFSTPINDEKPGTVQDRAAERELAVFKKRLKQYIKDKTDQNKLKYFNWLDL